MPSLRVVCLSTFLSICSTLTTLFHLFFSFLPPVVCSVRLKCRLLCKLVPYIRNRSLSLVPLGEARSQRKHVRRYISVLSLLREGEGERERVGGREREREKSWQGVRTRFESAFRRKVWSFRLLPFVTFAASAPACKRAESCLRAQITVQPQLFVAVSFPPFFHNVPRHTHVQYRWYHGLVIVSTCISILERWRVNAGVHIDNLFIYALSLHNAHWRFNFCLCRYRVRFTWVYFEIWLWEHRLPCFV